MCIHVYTTGAPSALKFLKQAFPDAVLDSFNPDMPSGQVRFPVSSDDAMRSGWYESEMIDGGRSVFFRFGRARPSFHNPKAETLHIFRDRLLKGLCNVDYFKFLCCCHAVPKGERPPVRLLKDDDGNVCGRFQASLNDGFLLARLEVDLGIGSGIVDFSFEDERHYMMVINSALSAFFDDDTDDEAVPLPGKAAMQQNILERIRQTFPDCRLSHVVVDGRKHVFPVGDEAFPSGCYVAHDVDRQVFVKVGRLVFVNLADLRGA
ncbi:MAG: hypothetical protein IKI30_00240 [Oxalobacter sp.]|nr:hypothetical protein [Oxalobacter sp.]